MDDRYFILAVAVGVLMILGVLVLALAVRSLRLRETTPARPSEVDPEARLAQGIAMGISIGTGTGVALGMALHNLALGIALASGIGIALGVAIGSPPDGGGR